MRIENMITIDILTASPHYFCKKCMETRKENLIPGIEGLKLMIHVGQNLDQM